MVTSAADTFSVQAPCPPGLCRWFSLIWVEKCFTYWINDCKRRTRLWTTQRKVDPSSLRNRNFFVLDSTCRITNIFCFLSWGFLTGLQECGPKMTEKEVLVHQKLNFFWDKIVICCYNNVEVTFCDKCFFVIISGCISLPADLKYQI